MQTHIFLQGATPEARRYAIKELARRAGVSRDFFTSWKIDVTSQQTTVTLTPDGNKRIRFKHALDEALRKVDEKDFPVGKAAWLETPVNTLLKYDLIIPLVEANGKPPLFQPCEQGTFVCGIDLLLSLLFTLTRLEEMASGIRDEHARFPASASLAVQHSFLERPIVDEYGLAFEQVLCALLPSWKPERPSLRVKLTHDIDSVGIPFKLRAAVGHTLKRREPFASLRDAASVFTGVEPAELALVRTLASISKNRGLHSAFFWKASSAGPKDSGYDPFHPKIQRVIADLKDQGREVGVHPGYDTLGSRSALGEEVERLRRALGVQRLGGRQHYLRWCPQTWLDWESCGLSYDSTVGFADFFGFRAGTAVPFRPWSLHENRELELVEVPLIVMDCTPVKYMGLSKKEGLDRIHNCIKRTALVGGVFTLLWHNAVLLEPEYQGWYESILNMLPSGRNLGFPESIHSFW
jgi:hypothetical protein